MISRAPVPLPCRHSGGHENKKQAFTEQVFLVNGAGAGGVGITEQIWTELMEQGMDETAAKKRIFTMDSRGVVTTDRELEPYKHKFAKTRRHCHG